MAELHLEIDRGRGGLSAQIVAALRDAVRSGRLPAGARLPSTRDLAADLAVSRGVVVTAYEQLRAEGTLLSRRGDGTRVAPSPSLPGAPAPTADLAAWPTAPPARPDPPSSTVADLRPGQPDLSAFPRGAWLGALRGVLREAPHGELLAYPDPAGARALRVALAGYLGRVRAAVAGPDDVTVVNGVAHGLSAVVTQLVRHGNVPLAVEDPTSERQLPLLRATGAELIPVPVDGEGLDVAALAATPARAVLVTPAHQYPTGVVLSPARRAALLAWARDTGGIVLEDDYDAEFRYDREPVGCLQGMAPGHVVLLGSVSKALAPGLRLGWTVAPPPVAAALREHRARTDLGGATPDQLAFARLLEGDAHDRHLRVLRRRYRARRDALVAVLAEHLPGARVHGVSAGLHLYVELPPGRAEADVVAGAAARGVVVSGAAELWSPGRAASAPAALVLGYGGVPTSALMNAVEILGRVVTPRAPG
ncbi:PLP-dependent aminotransferase family protein [Actinomadura flavalba]|uniref:MocR-like pyridoxine biosynthesis transcription factor PdxR n=1 Tax=Actinomadura flavalba TaxID=1120938 RepID=UPI00035C8C35|nr:PLP-dependent aminotransferase family protein [Actinomadura flavalba]